MPETNSQEPVGSQEQAGLAQIRDRRGKVPGILPKNAQAWVLGGIALLMVAVIALSGRNAPQAHKPANPSPAPAVVEPSQARIQEYRARIEEQTRKLAAEQAQLLQAKQALAGASVGSLSGPSVPSGAAATTGQGRPTAIRQGLENGSTGGDDQRRASETLASKTLFASNIALSYRKDPAAAGAATAGPAASQAKPAHSATEPDTGDDEDSSETKAPDPGLSRAQGKTYRLFEGTMIETVLTNRLDGSFSGPVNCMVTTNVYSHNHRHLLIPQGTRVLGEVRKLESFGQQRLAVFFHRLIMPDGFSASLDKFKGLNQIGETGLRDQVNHHYLEIFGVSLAIGMVAGFSQANTAYGLDASASDAYRQGVASSLSQSAMHILDRYLNILPTFTIREGHRIKVYLSEDLMLPAYDRHQLPDDL